MDFLLFVRWLQDIVMIIDFIVGLYILARFKILGNMLLIFFYNLLAASIAFMSIFRNHVSSELLGKVHYYSSLFHYPLLAVFILITPKPLIKNIISVSFFYVWLLLLGLLVLLNDHKSWMLIAAFSNTGLFILSGFYYYKLFSDTSPINIFSDTAFWVITGVFVCMCLSLPLIALHAFLDSRSILDIQTFKNISSIGGIAYTIMHLFFINAFLCSIRTVTT